MHSEIDIETLARTVYGEARGESYRGKQAVAWVVLNRAAGKKKLADVCRAKWQFSCWNPDDPNRVKMGKVTLADSTFRDCMLAALSVVQGLAGPDPTEGSKHYHTPAVAPFWGRGKEPVCRIGNHLFFNDID